MKNLLLTPVIFFLVLGIVNSQPYENMVLIPGGNFIMGKDAAADRNYSPAHEVEIDSFYMDAHELTNGEYLEFCKATGYKFPEFWGEDIFHCSENYLDYPVVGVNWFDASKYADWAGKRLPKEAEWEYAARGGLVGNEFPNGNEWSTEIRRNKPGTWENLTVTVQSFEPNNYGLYDMGGNVWELCNDVYHEDHYQNSVVNNPTGPERGGSRVIRGGGWRSGKMCHKVYFRKGLTSNWVDFAVGFRCVKDLAN